MLTNLVIFIRKLAVHANELHNFDRMWIVPIANGVALKSYDPELVSDSLPLSSTL